MLTIVVKMEEKRLLQRILEINMRNTGKRYQSSFHGFKGKSNNKSNLVLTDTCHHRNNMLRGRPE